MFGIKNLKRNKQNLQKEVCALKNQINQLKHFEKQDKLLVEANHDLVVKVNETNKKLREQTEADLYFVSAKIQKELLEGKSKKEVNQLDLLQVSLRNQLVQQQAQSLNVPFGGLGVLGASAGGRGIF